MVLRDGAEGLEVLLLRRSPHSVFVPGAHVFPGGAVEAGRPRPPPDGAGALADVRGVGPPRPGRGRPGLLGGRRAARPSRRPGCSSPTAPSTGPRPSGRRSTGASGPWPTVCADHGLTLRLGDLRYFGHWITPPGAPPPLHHPVLRGPRPAGTGAGRTTTARPWPASGCAPSVALDRFAAGDWDLILPTERSLLALDRFADVAAVLAHLDDRPPLTDDHGGRRVALPQEPATVARQEIPT